VNTALAIAESIRQRERSAVEEAQDYLSRLDRVNDSLNAVVWIDRDQLLRDARAADDALSRGQNLGPFHGVPLPVKGLIEVAGWPLEMGSRACAGMMGKNDATPIARMRAAGFVLAGLTNTPEFGSIPVTESERFGPAKNPWDLSLNTGGSSGGSSALIASGVSPIAHASDGGGSIRIPASCCGIFGLKPSRGRVPKGPVISEVMAGAAVDGFVTRDVADSAAALDTLVTPDLGAWYHAPLPTQPFVKSLKEPLPKLRIGFSSRTPVRDSCSNEVAKSLDDADQLLRTLGHDVFEFDQWCAKIPPTIAADFTKLWQTTSAYVWMTHPEQMEPYNRHLADQGRVTSSLDYTQAHLRLQVFSRWIISHWGPSIDFLLTPTVAELPPMNGSFAELSRTQPQSMIARGFEFAAYTCWFNITGQPAMSVPLYWHDDKIPVGVQLVAPPFREDLAFQLARQLELARPWAHRVPRRFVGLSGTH